MLIKNSFSYPKVTVPVCYGKEQRRTPRKNLWASHRSGEIHTGNSLTLIEFLVTDSDVVVNSCSVFGPDKMRGSTLFPLQRGTLTNVQSNSSLDPEECFTFARQNKYQNNDMYR